MKKYILLLLLPLVGCTTLPQTKDEFRADAHSSTTMSTSEVNMTGTAFSVVQGRMKQLAEQCFTGRKDTTCPGAMVDCHNGIATYTPTFDTTENSMTMYVQQRWDEGVINLERTSANGKFILLIEAVTKPDGSIHGTVYGPNRGFGTITEDSAKWLLGTSTTCSPFN